MLPVRDSVSGARSRPSSGSVMRAALTVQFLKKIRQCLSARYLPLCAAAPLAVVSCHDGLGRNTLMSKAAERPRQPNLDLAQRILQLAQESRMALGDRLPEQLLASRCNVSRTPI